MTNVNFCTIVNSLLSTARGTDFVRLRPASASVRFLRNFSCPPSALEKFLASTVRIRPWGGRMRCVRRPLPSAWEFFLSSAVRIRPWGGWTGCVRRPHPYAFKKFEPSTVRIRPLETVRIGQASAFVRFRPHLSASVRLWGPFTLAQKTVNHGPW